MSFIYTCKCGKQIERTGERQPHITYFCEPCFDAHMSGDDEKDATQAERAAVVKRLRFRAEHMRSYSELADIAQVLDEEADAIEKGEHAK